MCCGSEREVTVECPLDCEYLREARKHDKVPEPDLAAFPNRDLQISEKLLGDNEQLLAFLSLTIFDSAMRTPGAADRDVLEALDALIRTYRTLESGVLYETRPDNLLAAPIYSAVQEAVEEYRREEQKKLGMTRTRDAGVLGVLVFLQHFAMLQDNGRKRCRAFLSALRGFHAAGPSAASPSSVILR